MEKNDWEQYNNMKHKTINHVTYFDKKRPTYYKSKEF